MVQAALDALAASGGGTFRVPAGTTYSVNSLVWNSPYSLQILGEGRSSYLLLNSTTAGILATTNGHVDIKNLEVFHPTINAVDASVPFFTFVGTTGNLRDLTIYNGGTVAIWGSGAGGGARDITAAGMSGSGFSVDVSPTISGQQYGILNFDGLNITGQGANSGSGLVLVSADTVYVSNSNIGAFDIGVNATSSASRSYLANLFFTNVAADGAGGPSNTIAAWAFDGTQQLLGRVFMDNCWAGAMGGLGQGIYAKNVKTMHVSNSMVIDNGSTGINIDTGVRDFRLSHSVVTGNGQGAPGVYDGIRVGSGANNIHLEFNRSGPTYNGTSSGVRMNTQKYGIEVASSTVTNYSIIGNDLTGNTTAGLFDGGGGSSATKNVALNISGAAIP